MRGVFGGFQKRLAVREAVHFTGGRKDTCVDQIGQNGKKVVRDPAAVSDVSAYGIKS